MGLVLISAITLLVALAQATPTSPKPSGKSELATFDDLKDFLPGVAQPNPVGKYKGLNWNSLNVLEPGIAGIGLNAITPKSGKNVAANSMVTTLLAGGIQITPDTDLVASFDLEYVYFACLFATQESVVSEAQACTVSFTAYKSGRPEPFVTVNQQFNPISILPFFPSEMSKASFDLRDFAGLDRVDVAVVASANSNTLTALNLDSVKYTTYAK